MNFVTEMISLKIFRYLNVFTFKLFGKICLKFLKRHLTFQKLKTVNISTKENGGFCSKLRCSIVPKSLCDTFTREGVGLGIFFSLRTFVSPGDLPSILWTRQKMCISHHVNSSKNHHADELEIHKETHKDHEMTLLAEILVTANQPWPVTTSLTLNFRA